MWCCRYGPRGGPRQGVWCRRCGLQHDSPSDLRQTQDAPCPLPQDTPGATPSPRTPLAPFPRAPLVPPHPPGRPWGHPSPRTPLAPSPQDAPGATHPPGRPWGHPSPWTPQGNPPPPTYTQHPWPSAPRLTFTGDVLCSSCRVFRVYSGPLQCPVWSRKLYVRRPVVCRNVILFRE